MGDTHVVRALRLAGTDPQQLDCRDGKAPCTAADFARACAEHHPDLRYGKMTAELIDTIAMLEEKTRNNRGEEEDTYITGVLTNLRLEFVNKSS